MNPNLPKEIFKVGEHELKIVWEDGHESVYTAQGLRRACPCALCVDELTRKPTLDPATIPAWLKLDELSLAGNYAVAARFSDDHSSGIFAFTNLRKSCPCPACAKSAC